MDSITSTEDLCAEKKTTQENILFGIIKELCCETGKLSNNLKGKVNRIIADCDLTHYSSLHKLSTADESTAMLLGFMHQTTAELTFDEQAELNQAIIQKIQTKIPAFLTELERLQQSSTSNKKSHKDQIKELQENLDDKLGTLQEQETEKVELMMEWLTHRLQEVNKFSDNSTELLTLKKYYTCKSCKTSSPRPTSPSRRTAKSTRTSKTASRKRNRGSKHFRRLLLVIIKYVPKYSWLPASISEVMLRTKGHYCLVI